MITWSLCSYCTRKVIKENFALFSLPSVKNRLSKQLIVSVNIDGHVQLKGTLEKKIALMKLEDIVQQEEPIGKEFWDHKKIEGKKVFAPYDGIIVTCGAPFVPDELLAQLKVGGKMVAPIGDGDVQLMHLIEKISETENKITTHGNFSFVPMLNDKTNGN